jgi:hypothetical protein
MVRNWHFFIEIAPESRPLANGLALFCHLIGWLLIFCRSTYHQFVENIAKRHAFYFPQFE